MRLFQHTHFVRPTSDSQNFEKSVIHPWSAWLATRLNKSMINNLNWSIIMTWHDNTTKQFLYPNPKVLTPLFQIWADTYPCCESTKSEATLSLWQCAFLNYRKWYQNMGSRSLWTLSSMKVGVWVSKNQWLSSAC